ncbi:MAG: hypothetical protein RhofKO_19910 [Rhodothermales bacterium]
MPDRIYNEDEINTLLKRAAQIQHEQPGPDTAGLNRQELERLADEVGISQHALTQALREMHGGQAKQQSDGFHLFGGPRRQSVTRTLDVPLTDDTWQHIVVLLREHYGDVGTVAQLGRTREWHFQKGTKVDVTATEIQGRTRLTIHQLNDDALGGVHGAFDSIGFVFFVTFIAGATALPLSTRIITSTLVLMAALLSAWMLTRSITRYRAKNTDILVDRLDLALRREADTPEAAASLPEATAPLYLDDLPEDSEATAVHAARRTRA